MLASLMRMLMMKAMGMPTCEEVERLCYDYLDQRLDPRTTRRLERHLRLCRSCPEFIESYRLVRAVAPRGAAPALDEEFKSAVVGFMLETRR